MTKDVEQWATRVMLLAALGLGGGSLVTQPEGLTEQDKQDAIALAVKLESIDSKLEKITEGKEIDSKHWKFLNWLETCVRDLAHEHSSRLEPKPAL